MDIHYPTERHVRTSVVVCAVYVSVPAASLRGGGLFVGLATTSLSGSRGARILLRTFTVPCAHAASPERPVQPVPGHLQLGRGITPARILE